MDAKLVFQTIGVALTTQNTSFRLLIEGKERTPFLHWKMVEIL
jgi:hypothetical protein